MIFIPISKPVTIRLCLTCDEPTSVVVSSPCSPLNLTSVSPLQFTLRLSRSRLVDSLNLWPQRGHVISNEGPAMIGDSSMQCAPRLAPRMGLRRDMTLHGLLLMSRDAGHALADYCTGTKGTGTKGTHKGDTFSGLRSASARFRRGIFTQV